MTNHAYFPVHERFKLIKSVFITIDLSKIVHFELNIRRSDSSNQAFRIFTHDRQANIFTKYRIKLEFFFKFSLFTKTKAFAYFSI